jgi:arsenate reductase (thioredoxin)
MNQGILTTVEHFSQMNISEERIEVLQALIDYISDKKANDQTIRLNFICTHNSRRSHLAQIWAQTMAYHYGIKNVFCYSGGTEATAMFSKVAETLGRQGFDILVLSDTSNPVYAVKYAANEHAIVCFSKKYDDAFNPQNEFGAIVTCGSADEACPIVVGAEKRFAIKYLDPKAFDGSPDMDQKYMEKSIEIGQEMWYVFSKIG